MGWDTKGVTKCALLESPRIVREFTGKDGVKRNIFVPIESVSVEITTLMGLLQQAQKEERFKDRIGSDMSLKSLINLKGITFGSSDDGQEFILSLESADGLRLRFHLDRPQMESIATVVTALAQKHGLTTTISGGSLN